MAKKKKVEHKPREYTRRQLSSHRRQLRRQRFFLFGGIAIIAAVFLIILGGWIVGEYMPLRKTVIEVFEKKFDTSFYIDTVVLLTKLQGSGGPVDIATPAVNQIMQDELIIQEAEKLGFIVSDEEAVRFWESINYDVDINDAAIHFAKSYLLADTLKNSYFPELVPAIDKQVHVRAMFVESESVAQYLRDKIINGENFSLLAEEYAQNTPSKDNNGDFGWHPASILKDLLLADIPIEYVTRADTKPGDVSPPLIDNEYAKEMGYWLIRVNERPTEDSANVSAIYLSSEEEALAVRARLEAGEELDTIADNLSQYSPTQMSHGELGLLYSSDIITDAFNGYVFTPTTELGVWSQPVHEDTLWTKGGAWIVQVVDKDENRELSAEDRDSLINTSYTNWMDEVYAESSPFFINNLGGDTELMQWAIDRAARQL